MKTVKLEVRQHFNDYDQLIEETWRLGSKYHNPAGPAARRWYDNGQLMCETYYLDSVLHNSNGPAYYEWDDDGQLLEEEYWLYGKLHNSAGPAYRRWEKGELVHEVYKLDGKEVSKEEWQSRTRTCVGKIIEFEGKQYKLVEVPK